MGMGDTHMAENTGTHGEHKGSHEEFTEGSHDVTNEEKYQVTEGDCANRLELTGTLCGKGMARRSETVKEKRAHGVEIEQTLRGTHRNLWSSLA